MTRDQIINRIEFLRSTIDSGMAGERNHAAIQLVLEFDRLKAIEEKHNALLVAAQNDQSK